MKKWCIVLSSVIFLISIWFIQSDTFSSTLNAMSATPYSEDGIDREPGGRKITQLEGRTILIENGEVFVWGDNTYGQIGNGTTVSTSYPEKVAIDDVVEIKTNNYTMLAKKKNGDLYGWGVGINGIFGDGTLDNRLTPAIIPFDKSYFDYTITGGNIIFHADDGKLYGSGDNYVYDLGKNAAGVGIQNNTRYNSEFVLMELPSAADTTLLHDTEKIINYRSGEPFYLDAQGQMLSFGTHIGNGRGDDGANKGISSTTCKSPATQTGQCIVKQLVYTQQSLNQDSTHTNIDHVEEMAGATSYTPGSYYMTRLVLKDNGEVFAWGSNTEGNLGNGGTTSYYYAAPVKGIDDNGFLTNGKAVAADLDTSAVLLTDGRIVGFGSNDNKKIMDSSVSNYYYPTIMKAGNQNVDKNADFQYASDIELFMKSGSVQALTEFNQVFSKGASSDGSLGLNEIKSTPDFTKLIVPIKPIITGSTRLDADNKELIDDPETTTINESVYDNTVDENGTITKWDKYNSSVNLTVKREGMLQDDGVNETAIDYGDMKYEYCELEYNDKKEAVCKKDKTGKEVWVTPSDNLISKRTAYPDVDDTELVDVNNTPDDPSDDVMRVKEHDVLIDMNGSGAPTKAFRKYRFFYDEVRERYDVENSGYDPYSYYIVDLSREDPDVKFLPLNPDKGNKEIVTLPSYLDDLELPGNLMHDQHFFSSGIRIYLPEGASGYVIEFKTKDGKKTRNLPKTDAAGSGGDTNFGDGRTVSDPILRDGKANGNTGGFEDFFPRLYQNGKYEVLYKNEYGNSVALKFTISNDTHRPLLLPGEGGDANGGDWLETKNDKEEDLADTIQHYGGVYIIDTKAPGVWNATAGRPNPTIEDPAISDPTENTTIYKIEDWHYTKPGEEDYPRTVSIAKDSKSKTITHDWINHSLWLTLTGRDIEHDTSSLCSVNIYKLREDDSRITPADTNFMFNEGDRYTVKNDIAFPVKENGNYELVLQDCAGNENVSQGNSSRGLFFNVGFIDTEDPVIKEPVKVRDPKTNELNITLEAEDDVSGVRSDDPDNDIYGMYYQFVADGDNPDDTKWLPYVQSDSDPAHILHVPNKNFIGKLYVKAYDNAGNISGDYDDKNNYANMIAFDIADDSDAPVITYKGENPTDWQNSDVMVNFTASDNLAIEKVDLVKQSDESVVDTFEPKYQNHTYSECKTENHNCVIKGNELDFSFTISENDIYQVIAYDMAGNKTIAIIDNMKADPDDKKLDVKYIDKDDPSATITRTKKGELKISAKDDLSGIKTSGTPSALRYDGIEYLIIKEADDVNWNETTIQNRTDWNTYDPANLADANAFDCYVYIRITDKAGNAIVQKSDLFEVTDLEPPHFVVSRETTSSTYRRGINNAVKVSVNYTDNIALKEIEVRVDPTSTLGGQLVDVNGNAVTEYKKSDYKNTKDDWFDFYVKQDGDYQVRGTDESGNTSDWVDLEVEKIDQIEPTMDVAINNGKFKVENANGTISAIAKVMNDKGVLVEDIAYQFVKDGDSVEENNYILVSQGTEVSIPKGFTGILYVRCYDEAKLQFDSNSKGNMKLIKKSFEKAEPSDKEPPKLITITGNPTKWQNTDANLTLTITDNESGVVRVTVKDQLSGMILFNKTDFADKTLNITIPNVQIKTNGTYIIEMEDADGNISDNALDDNLIKVTKIDKRKPIIENISWVNGGNILFPNNDLKADISDYDEPKEDNSTIVEYKYAFVKKGDATPDPDTWDVISKDDVDTILKTDKNFVGKLVLRAIDAAGNESETLTANVGQDTGKDSKPVIEVVQEDREPWLKAGNEMEIIVRVKEPIFGITHVEVMDHASGLSTTYAPYDNTEPDFKWHEYKFKVTENGMYTIKAVNANDDVATLPIYVSHFDTTAPIISSIEWMKNADSATIHASDPMPGSGLSIIYYQFVDEGKKMDESAWQTLKQRSSSIAIDPDYKGSIYAKACDVVGNCSDISIQSLYISEGTTETDKPVVEILNVKDEKESEQGSAEIKVSDQTSGVKYFVVTGPGVVGSSYVMVKEEDKLSSEHTISFNKNGVYTIVAYDYVGNISDPISFTVENLKETGTCIAGKLPELNIDSDGNGIPDLNLDPFDTGKPSINVDLNCDTIPDVNIDNDGDGNADLNIDHNDGIPYKNLITLYSWKPNKDFTLLNGYHYETMTNLKATNEGEVPNAGGAVNGDVQGSYTNNVGNTDNTNKFIPPVLGSMEEHPWWWILLLILSMIVMRWGYERAVIYYDEKRIEKYMEDQKR